MALETFHIVFNDGVYGCGDIGVTAEEWYSILRDKKAIPYLEALLCFLREPEMKSTCVRLSDKYGKPPQYYNSKITAFSKWVQKKLSRFVVLNTDGEVSYWGIAMQKGWEVKNNFWWQLREELAEALREYLMRDLIRELGTREIFNGYYEEYKWALIDKTEGLDAIGIAKSILLSRSVIEMPHNAPALKYLIEQKPVDLSDCCARLFEENIPLSQRVAEFKSGMRSICPSNMKNCANDERTVSALLACKYPYNYTFYQSTVYEKICEYLGYDDVKNPGLKFCHFTEIINKLAERYGEEVQPLMLAKISGFRNKPLNLAIQTLFWCMKEYIMNQMNTNKKFTNGSVSESDNEEAGWLDYITGILRKRKNLVLYGAPGTGKTYMVPELAVRLCDPDFDVNGSDRDELIDRYNQLKVEKRISFTTFHQSMDYEDWLEGLRPIVGDSNQVTYEVEEGIFKRLCDEAENNTKPYVMVIDEMNRGNVSKIFGELITLLEVDKRKGCKNAESVMLPYSKKYFQIPDNVYIIATMNSADRSLGSIDYAVRRRFAFVACKPWGLMVDGFDSELFEMVSKLFIANYDEYASSGFGQFLKLQPSETLSEEYRPEDVWIGHSYFIMNDENGNDITSDRLYYEIIPLLEEYVRDGVLNPDAQDTIDELYKRAGQL